MPVEQRFLRTLEILARHKVEFIMVGGVACLLHGANILTDDLDIVYQLSPTNFERLAAALEELGASYVDPAGRTIHPDVSKLASMKIHLLRTANRRLDALQSIGDNRTYDQLVVSAEHVDLGSIHCQIASLQDIIESKEFANRPKDRAMLPYLHEAAHWQPAAEASTEFFAHSKPDVPTTQWQALATHLNSVADLAAKFSSPFCDRDWGLLAGLWHDLGKYQPAFQRYIARQGSQIEHAIVGALFASQKDDGDGLSWPPLAFTIAGHHGGLPNPIRSESGKRGLRERMNLAASLLEAAVPHVPDEIADHRLPKLPARFAVLKDPGERARSTELWIRFLFSALVDADFLDTEAFYNPNLRQEQLQGSSSLATLRQRLDTHIDQLAESTSGAVNQLRAEVLSACRDASSLPPGLFSLSVPTGGGKTLSSMSFALRHAQEHDLRRVIAVIPFTSIIEQTAKVFRGVLGAENVIEHHSNLDPDKETARNRLASENWDAPLIVTTAVQFFESLLANRPARCRKLHNIARSVILLDEAQTLPPEFMVTILELLKELTANYGCTVLLSTATQPALTRRPSLPFGLDRPREIIPNPEEMATRLRRIEVRWPKQDEVAEWPHLASELTQHSQALTIVHRRQDARDLFELLPIEGRFHLSALMCAAHRMEVLTRVKTILASGAPCRLVSTQLIEAGVDIDFPCVYRALGGLDSLVQAAGRCNREGHLEKGEFVIFRAPTPPPPGAPRKGLQETEILLERYGDLDLEAPDRFEEYFRRLYMSLDPDKHKVQVERQGFNFVTVAHLFQLILDDYSQPVVVPFGDGPRRLDQFRAQEPSRRALRRLQPYLVSVPNRDLQRLEQDGAVELIHDMVYAVSPLFEKLYDDELGLRLEGGSPDPALLMA